MLHTYNAEISGSELTWLDVPPVPLQRQRVVVLIEEVGAPVIEQSATRYHFADIAGRLQWRGDAVAAQRAQRDAW